MSSRLEILIGAMVSSSTLPQGEHRFLRRLDGMGQGTPHLLLALYSPKLVEGLFSEVRIQNPE
jgi:hypothetical protein